MRSEFEFIKHLKNHFNLGRIGDDCAVLPKDDLDDLLNTSDILNEHIDFRLEWTTPNNLGHKVLSVSISDISAMGGIPLYALTSISIPESLWNSTFLDEFYAGFNECANTLLHPPFGHPFEAIELVGGDISKSESGLTIESTLIGKVSKGKAILRSGAEPGDLIFVTGLLGLAAAGLKTLENNQPASVGIDTEAFETPSVTRQLKGHFANGHQFIGVATSMIDISDGLSSDLFHICNASNVGARIYADKLPVPSSSVSKGSIKKDIIDMALNGGEDFELLLTAPANARNELESAGLTVIGEIIEEKEVIQLVEGKNTTPLAPRGFQHF